MREDISRRALDAMDRLNKKNCQEELERINANIYPDTKIDCGNCQFNNPDPKTAFLTELSELLRKYDAKIRWSIGLTYKNRMRSSANIEVHTPNFSHYFSGETGVTITPDNIFDYEKR